MVSSFGSPIRRCGAASLTQRRNASMPNTGPVISLGNQPGAIAFTRIPRPAQLHARLRVRLMTAAFDVW